MSVGNSWSVGPTRDQWEECSSSFSCRLGNVFFHCLPTLSFWKVEFETVSCNSTRLPETLPEKPANSLLLNTMKPHPHKNMIMSWIFKFSYYYLEIYICIKLCRFMGGAIEDNHEAIINFCGFLKQWNIRRSLHLVSCSISLFDRISLTNRRETFIFKFINISSISWDRQHVREKALTFLMGSNQ